LQALLRFIAPLDRLIGIRPGFLYVVSRS